MDAQTVITPSGYSVDVLRKGDLLVLERWQVSTPELRVVLYRTVDGLVDQLLLR